jgi:SNF2 family DNA or RNA helicase
MSDAAVVSILDQWNSGTVKLLCAQADAAAHGLNLQFGGSKLCWFSQTYNLEVYLQLMARLWRQGQADAVIVYHLLAKNTIDFAIRKVLSVKGITQDALFAALRYELLQ